MPFAQSDGNDVKNPHDISEEGAASPLCCTHFGSWRAQPRRAGWAQTGALWLIPHPLPGHRAGHRAAAQPVPETHGRTASSTFWENPGPRYDFSLCSGDTEKCTEMIRDGWAGTEAQIAAEGTVQCIIRACASTPVFHCLQSLRQNIPCFQSTSEI